MKKKIKKYIVTLLFIAGLFNAPQLYACDSWADSEDWNIDDWATYVESGNADGEGISEADVWTNAQDFIEYATPEQLEDVLHSLDELGIDNPDLEAEIIHEIQEDRGLTNEPLEYEKIYGALDAKNDFRPVIGERLKDTPDNVDINNNGIKDGTEDLDNNGINDFEQDLDGDGQPDYYQDTDGDGIPDREDDNKDVPWWETGSQDDSNSSSNDDENTEDDESGSSDADKPDTTECKGVQCPICNGYISTSTLKGGSTDCPVCSCSPCVKLQTRVNDLYNRTEFKDYLNALSTAAENGAAQQTTLLKDETQNMYLATNPVAGGLPQAFSADGTSASSDIGAAYNQTPGATACFTNQQMLDLMNMQASHANFQTVFVTSYDANTDELTTYALTVTDGTRVTKENNARYTSRLDANGDFKNGTRQNNDYWNAYRALIKDKTLEEADADAKAYMYEVSKMGVTLLKAERDDDGNITGFKQITLNVNKDGNGNITSISLTDCK